MRFFAMNPLPGETRVVASIRRIQGKVRRAKVSEGEKRTA